MKHYLLKKYPSFTLIEAVGALLLLSLTLLIFQGALQQFLFYKEKVQRNSYEEFHLFLMQLHYEISEFTFVELEDQQLVMKDEEDKVAYFQLYQEMIRKNYKGGHHPLLFHVKSWDIQKEQLGFQVAVTFYNQISYEGFVPYVF